MSRLAMIAVFTSFSISRGKIFSQKIQKFSICKNAFILSQTCKVFFRFSLKLTTVKVFYNVPQKKIASAWSSSTTCSNGFFSIHIPANKYVGLDFYLSFFFLLSNSFWFLLVLSMQIAETADFLFTAKGLPPKYLDSRSLNKKYILIWWPWTENT